MKKIAITFGLLLLPLVSFAVGVQTKELYCPTAACDLKEMVLYIIWYFLRIIPIVSVLFIIIGGFKMVTAAGNQERYAEAKRTALNAVIGLVVAVLSFSIVAIVLNFLGAQIPPIY